MRRRPKQRCPDADGLSYLFALYARSSRDNDRMVYVRSALSAVDADMLIVPWFEEDTAASVAGVSTASGGELERAIGTKELSGWLYELFIVAVTDATWKVRCIAFVVSVRSVDFSGEVVRKVAWTG